MKLSPEEKERDKNEKKRFDTLSQMYHVFIEQHEPELSRKDFYLCNELLFEVVHSYFDDIGRFKDYTKSPYADHHKQAGYFFKWISKIRPIQLIPTDRPRSSKEVLVNASFALNVGLSFLDRIVFEKITSNLVQHLLYTAQYRTVSGKQTATSFYILEQACLDNEYP